MGTTYVIKGKGYNIEIKPAATWLGMDENHNATFEWVMADGSHGSAPLMEVHALTKDFSVDLKG